MEFYVLILSGVSEIETERTKGRVCAVCVSIYVCTRVLEP